MQYPFVGEASRAANTSVGVVTGCEAIDARLATPRAVPLDLRLAVALSVVPDCVAVPAPQGRELRRAVPPKSLHAGELDALTVAVVDPVSVVDGVRETELPPPEEVMADAVWVTLPVLVGLAAVAGSLSADDAAATVPDDVEPSVAPVVFTAPRTLDVCSTGMDVSTFTPVTWAWLKLIPVMGLPEYPLPAVIVIAGLSDVAVAWKKGWQGAAKGWFDGVTHPLEGEKTMVWPLTWEATPPLRDRVQLTIAVTRKAPDAPL
ncbi:MAG: hypothetical protein JOZ04_05175 [Acidimicrobiia bacterium]|nr:hypothetical protein [Acidimicrobiia bacterium]